MSMLAITAEKRRALRARAHGLAPVVAISQNGLSEAVLREIARSLDSHELIKIRVFNGDREARATYLASICERLGAAPIHAAPIQHIGKLLVIWRPAPDDGETSRPPQGRATTTRPTNPGTVPNEKTCGKPNKRNRHAAPSILRVGKTPPRA